MKSEVQKKTANDQIHDKIVPDKIDYHPTSSKDKAYGAAPLEYRKLRREAGDTGKYAL